MLYCALCVRANQSRDRILHNETVHQEEASLKDNMYHPHIVVLAICERSSSDEVRVFRYIENPSSGMATGGQIAHHTLGRLREHGPLGLG